MSFDLHSRRWKPRWLLPAIGTGSEKTSDDADVSPFSPDEDPTCNLTERDIDQALEQIVSEKCRVCPLCGSIVTRDGFVVL